MADDGELDELILAGGLISTVVRVGDTVRRTPARQFVRRLLRLFERVDWSGAPRLLGTDAAGRDVLSYLDGVVPWERPHAADVRTEPAVRAAARLLREFHDLTAGSPLAGRHEVVCHNDVSPKNTVYRLDPTAAGDPVLVPIAFLDWDIAAPGDRLHDLAHLCWQFLGLEAPVADGPPGDDPLAVAVELLPVVCESYGEGVDRSRLIETVVWWQERCARGIRVLAARGDPPMTELVERGDRDGHRAGRAVGA